MFDFLKKIPQKQIELALSAMVILVAVGGAGYFTYFLFMQNQDAKIAIKGGSLGKSKGGGGKAGGGGSGPASSSRSVEGTGDPTGATPATSDSSDPTIDKSPGEIRADAADDAADRGDYAGALAYYKAALAGEPDNVDYLEGAGEAALKSGAYDEAEDYLRKAVARHRSAGGKEGNDRSAALANNLSRALLAKGNVNEAEQVIGASVKAQGKESPRFGESMTSWATAAHAAGKDEVAVKAAQEGAGFFKKKGPLNPHYMSLLLLTAKMANEKKNYAAAETAIKEALVVAERQNGRNSDEVSRILRRHGLLLFRQGKYLDAHEKLTDALAIARHLYPAGSELESDTLRSLALIDETLYPGQAAERRLREAHKLDHNIHGAGHRRTAESGVLLARYLSGAGQYMEAEGHYIDAIGMWKDGAVDDLTAAGWLVTFGDLLERMGRDDEAAEMRGLAHDLGKKHQER